MKILLADDHALFREGLRLIFNKLQPNIEVTEVDTLHKVSDILADGSRFDIILLDLRMPGVMNLDSIKEIVEQAHEMPVVIMSGAYRRDDVLRSIEFGASGFIPKTLGADSMISAINLILNGEKFIPSVICSDANEIVQDETPAKALFDKLTQREREVLKHLAEGHSNKVIASLLDLQEVTVRAHLKGVFRKLNVSSRTQAVGLALRNGFNG